MFRIIHPNRWFFWAIAVIIATSLVLLINIQKTAQEFEDQAMLDASPAVWKTYESQALGMAISYPPSWQIELDPDDANIFYLENPRNFSENISVSAVKPSLESVIRSALAIGSERKIMVDGAPASWIQGRELKDRATANVLFIPRGAKLYYIAGSARVFEDIINSVKFIR